MFESIVSTVLNQVLGNYVANLEQNQLKLGIFSGNVVLRNLKLKKEAIDNLNLPIQFIDGHLGCLELRIPWANLKTQPVRVLISDLYLLAGPLEECDYDPAAENKKSQKAKQELLETAELFRSSAANKEGQNDLANETFMNSLITKVVDNLQIVIKNIHVRYEDFRPHLASPFAFGLTLSNLSAVSTNSSWAEAFIENPLAPIYKLAKLDSLAVYWTPNCKGFNGLDQAELFAQFKNLIHSEANNVDMRYLLKPVSGVGKIIMNKKPKTGEAKNLANIEFEGFNLKMDNEQYFDVLLLVQTFILNSRNMNYRQYRPALALKPKLEPAAWFRYAVTCVLEKIKSRNKSRLWLTVVKRRQIRIKYVVLFKKKEVDGSLLGEDLAHFSALEEMLSFEDTKFYRSLARLEMKEERLIPFSLKQQQKPTSIISRWWPYSTGETDALIKEEDIKNFYDTIDFDKNLAKASEKVAKDAKFLELSFDLKCGSIGLAQTTGSSSRKTILSLQFVELVAHIIKRTDTLRMEISLLDFSILENLTDRSIFPNLVRAKRNSSDHPPAVARANRDELEEIKRMASLKTDPFLSFVMDELSSDPNADKSIAFSMKPLEIVFNHQAVKKITEFVYGGRAKEVLESLASAAEQRINDLANKTRASLEFALEEHKALDLSVKIDAPVIYIPYDCEDPNGFLFVADLGHIEIRSKLVTQEEKKNFSKKRRVRLSQQEMDALYGLMYDVLEIQLSKIKLGYANSLAEWNQLNIDPEFLPEANRVIEDIDVSLSVASCIVPQAINLAQTKVYASIPRVQVIFSDEKYKKVMQLMEFALPKSDAAKASVDGPKKSQKSIIDLGSSSHHTMSLSPVLEKKSDEHSRNSSDLTGTDDEFFDAIDADFPGEEPSETSIDEKPAYEAIKLDLTLEIGEVCAKLIRENRKYRRKDLMTVVAKKFKVFLNVQPFNTVLNLILESFFIRDDLNFGHEGMGEVFILSGLGHGPEPGDESSSLLRVNVNLVDPAHPLFITQYNAAGIQAAVQLAALNVFLHPPTLIAVAEFFGTMLEQPDSFETDYYSRDGDLSKLKKSKSSSQPQRTASKASFKSSHSEGQLAHRRHQALDQSASSKPSAAPESKKILLNAKLSEFSVKFGIGSGHFADIVLSSAVAGFCLDQGDVQFNGKIADLAVLHRRRPAGESSDFAFLRIEGGHVLDFTFNTFTSLVGNQQLYPGFDQMVKLTTGALHFTYDSWFIEDLARFALQMTTEAQTLTKQQRSRDRKVRRRGHAFLEEADDAEEEDENEAAAGLATILEDEDEEDSASPSSKLKFEIDIGSPVLNFPNPKALSDVLSVYFGHFHASNQFVAATDRAGSLLKFLGGQVVDQFISAQLEAMRIILTCSGREHQLLEDVSAEAKVSLIARAVDRDYAELDVEGGVDAVRLKIARDPLEKLLSLISNLQASLECAMKPIQKIQELSSEKSSANDQKPKTNRPGKEYVVDEHNALPTAVEVDFGIKTIELVLFEEWEVAPVARFALEGLSTVVILQKDQSMILEQYIKSICASDLRPNLQRKFTEIIIPSAGTDAEGSEDVKMKYERTTEGDQIVKVMVNAPKIVLSMDFINSVLSVFEGLNSEGSKPLKNDKAKEAGAKHQATSSLLSKDAANEADLSPTSLGISEATSLASSLALEVGVLDSNGSKRTFVLAEVLGMNLFILEDPSSASTEAMQLTVGHVTFAQQSNMSLTVDGVTAGFVNMDNLASVVQFLDPFNISATVELDDSLSAKSTQVWAVVEPIILRLSYQDVQFFTKLSEQFGKQPEVKKDDEVSNSLQSLKVEEPLPEAAAAVPAETGFYSLSPALSLISDVESIVGGGSISSVALKKIIEKIQFNLEGLRLVLIDDFSKVHIPLLDVAVDRIAAEVTDWSSGMKLSGILKLYANFFNRLNSHWEPLIEPWSLDLSVKQPSKSLTEILLASEKILDINLSHAFLDQILAISAKLARAAPRAASSYREVSKPYLIRNFTGYRLSLWSESRLSAADGQPEIVEIAANSDFPYEFEDWRVLRLSAKSRTYKLSLHLMDSSWESVKNVCVDQEGLFVYALRPRIDSVAYKLVCEVKLVEGVRHIILRGATCFRNETAFDLEIKDMSVGAEAELIIVQAGGIGSLPLKFSAGGAFQVRPHGLHYQWSGEKFELAALLNAAKEVAVVRQARCESMENDATPFHLAVQGVCDTPEEIIYASASLAAKAASKRVNDSSGYGLGSITFSSPLELENLLPFGFKYRIYDHDGKYDYAADLSQGGLSPLHGVDITHVIGLSLEIAEQDLKTKEVAVINNTKTSKCDGRVWMIDSEGREGNISIDYQILANGTKRLRIYAPYVVINQTDLPMEFKSSTSFIGFDQLSPCQKLFERKPFLFSYPESNLVSGKGRIKLRYGEESAEWSRQLSLDAVGNVNYFDIQSGDKTSWYNLSLYVQLGSARFAKVHIAKLAPRFMLLHRLGSEKILYVRAGGSMEPVMLADDVPVAFHCAPAQFGRVQISLDGEAWGPEFSITDVADTFIKLPKPGSLGESVSLPFSLIKVGVSLEVQVMQVAFTKSTYWPFKLMNRSSIEVKFAQKGFPERANLLLPGETVNFAWEDPSVDPLLLTVTVRDRERHYNIRELGAAKPLVYHLGVGREKAYLSVDVSADGAVLIVRFKNYDPQTSRSIFRLLGEEKTERGREAECDQEIGEEDDDDDDSKTSSNSAKFTVASLKDEDYFKFTLQLAGIGCSLIGPDLVEFIYILARDFEVRLQKSRLYQTLGLKIGWLQVDNCLFDYTHPILLYPSVVKRSESKSHPTVSFGLIKSAVEDESRGAQYFKYFGLLLQEMNLEVGEEVIRKLLPFVQFSALSPDAQKPLLNESDFEISLPGAKFDAAEPHNELMYFELFQIHPIKINLTFSRIEDGGDDVSVKKKGGHGGVGGFGGIAAYNPLGPVLSILSMASGNISEAPLKFNSLLLEHPIVTGDTLKNRLVSHYSSQAIVQVHRILGSIDVLGNPVGLFTTMGSGVTDLFYEPYQGFVSDRPQDIGIGLARGGFSFVKKTVSGLSGTFSKLTGSLGKGLAAATFDTAFQRSRRTRQARNRPRNAVLGLTSGARSFYDGVASGLTGIVEKPWQGAQRDGVGGFFRGMGVGLLGAVTKPIVGALDLTTSISEGVRMTADSQSLGEDEIVASRWPRIIPYNGVVTRYVLREALGQSCLAACLQLTLGPERYFAHLEILEDDRSSSASGGDGAMVFVTTLRVIYAKRRNFQITWQVPYDELLFCRPNFDSVMLSIKRSDCRKRLIFCSDAASQEWLCTKIDEAMAIYAEKHRAVE